MNREEIIRMAMEADVWVAGLEPYQSRLEHFAALVAAAEREACAKVCDNAISSIFEFHPEPVSQAGRNVCTNLAAAIRARGEK
jgi:hypothetical protein